MPYRKLKKLNVEAKQFGIPAFVKLKVTEKYYKHLFKKMGVHYDNAVGGTQHLNSQSAQKDSRRNECTAYFIIKLGMKVTGIRNRDIGLLDFGCGNGKVLTFGMYKKFRQVIGVDLCPEALKAANANCSLMKKNGYQTNYKVEHADASSLEIPEGTNIVYIANSFGEATMRTVLENITRYCNSQRNDVYLVYAIAVHRDLMKKNKQCTKMFEDFNGRKTHPELTVFKISPAGK